MNKKEFNTYTKKNPYLMDYFNALGFEKGKAFRHYRNLYQQTLRNDTESAQGETVKAVVNEKKKKIDSLLFPIIMIALFSDNAARDISGGELLSLNTGIISFSVFSIAINLVMRVHFKKKINDATTLRENLIERQTWEKISENAKTFQQERASNSKAQPRPLL